MGKGSDMSHDDSQTYSYKAEVSQVLNLVVNSLYSNKEIFLRELISNASDAIDKLKFKAIDDKSLLGDGELAIHLSADRDAKTVTIADDGVGMTHDELVENLGTIAHSGTQAFMKAVRDSGGDASLIGQFGVGFYSAFLVADEVEVLTRAAGEEKAWRWRSDAKSTFTVEPAERDGHGTSVILHVKEDAEEFLDEWRLRSLVRQYSDFVSHPIKMKKTGEDEEGTETVNEANALWQRPKDEITDEQYAEFYKHVSHDFDEPLAHTHFRIEGTQLFTGLVFIPKRAPFDLYDRDHRRGVRLYVKRVFIMDNAEDLLPVWLRFVRGVVDSDDLPLNVSRELLQDSRMARTIRKQLVKKTLDLLEDLAANKPEDYAAFWKTFGPVLKEGLHYDREYQGRLAKLMRYSTSKHEEPQALADYVERMPEDQPAIYYIIGDSRSALLGSPHLEALKKRGYEVLLMTDPVDEWAVHGLPEFEGKKLLSALDADLELSESEEEKKSREEKQDTYKGLVDAIGKILEDRVSEVRLSSRLTDSPACLVVPDGGLSAHMERLLRAQDREMPAPKRIFEVNPDHVLLERLEQLRKKDPGSDKLIEWVEMLYDQALLTEGSPLADPNRFARRLTRLMEEASFSAVMG